MRQRLSSNSEPSLRSQSASYGSSRGGSLSFVKCLGRGRPCRSENTTTPAGPVGHPSHGYRGWETPELTRRRRAAGAGTAGWQAMGGRDGERAVRGYRCGKGVAGRGRAAGRGDLASGQRSGRLGGVVCAVRRRSPTAERGGSERGVRAGTGDGSGPGGADAGGGQSPLGTAVRAEYRQTREDRPARCGGAGRVRRTAAADAAAGTRGDRAAVAGV